MMNKNVPFGVAGAAVGLVVALITLLGWKLQGAGEPAPRKLDRAFCLSCHSDARMLALMKRKEANTHFIFSANDPILAKDASYHTWAQPQFHK